MKLLLRLYANLLPKYGYPEGEILMFANLPNLGIGNIVWMYHTMAALEPLGLTVVIDNKEMRKIIGYNLPMSRVVSFDDIPKIKYRSSISNFVVQTKKNAKKIIDLRIPCRVGHIYDSISDYGWLFNYPVLSHSVTSEFNSNAKLANEFGVSVSRKRIDMPPTNIRHRRYDILIQPHTSNSDKRNFLHYGEVINRLGCSVGLIGSSKEYEYCQMIADATGAENLCGMSIIDTCHTAKKAKMVIGNDGGLIKLINAMGVKTLQIHRKDSPYYWRSRLDETDLIEPTLDTVVGRINESIR